MTFGSSGGREYFYDNETMHLLEDLRGFYGGRDYSHTCTKALRLFSLHLQPVVDVFLQKDLGDSRTFVVKAKPWTEKDFVSLLPKHVRSFTNGDWRLAEYFKRHASQLDMLTCRRGGPGSTLVEALQYISVIRSLVKVFPERIEADEGEDVSKEEMEEAEENLRRGKAAIQDVYQEIKHEILDELDADRRGYERESFRREDSRDSTGFRESMRSVPMRHGSGDRNDPRNDGFSRQLSDRHRDEGYGSGDFGERRGHWNADHEGSMARGYEQQQRSKRDRPLHRSRTDSPEYGDRRDRFSSGWDAQSPPERDRGPFYSTHPSDGQRYHSGYCGESGAGNRGWGSAAKGSERFNDHGPVDSHSPRRDVSYDGGMSSGMHLPRRPPRSGAPQGPSRSASGGVSRDNMTGLRATSRGELGRSFSDADRARYERSSTWESREDEQFGQRGSAPGRKLSERRGFGKPYGNRQALDRSASSEHHETLGEISRGHGWATTAATAQDRKGWGTASRSTRRHGQGGSVKQEPSENPWGGPVKQKAPNENPWGSAATQEQPAQNPWGGRSATQQEPPAQNPWGGSAAKQQPVARQEQPVQNQWGGSATHQEQPVQNPWGGSATKQEPPARQEPPAQNPWGGSATKQEQPAQNPWGGSAAKQEPVARQEPSAQNPWGGSATKQEQPAQNPWGGSAAKQEPAARQEQPAQNPWGGSAATQESPVQNPWGGSTTTQDPPTRQEQPAQNPWGGGAATQEQPAQNVWGQTMSETGGDQEMKDEPPPKAMHLPVVKETDLDTQPQASEGSSENNAQRTGFPGVPITAEQSLCNPSVDENEETTVTQDNPWAQKTQGQSENRDNQWTPSFSPQTVFANPWCSKVESPAVSTQAMSISSSMPDMAEEVQKDPQTQVNDQQPWGSSNTSTVTGNMAGTSSPSDKQPVNPWCPSAQSSTFGSQFGRVSSAPTNLNGANPWNSQPQQDTSTWNTADAMRRSDPPTEISNFNSTLPFHRTEDEKHISASPETESKDSSSVAFGTRRLKPPPGFEGSVRRTASMPPSSIGHSSAEEQQNSLPRLDIIQDNDDSRPPGI